MNKKAVSISLVISIIFAAVWNIAAFANECNEIRSECVRLHILANSDSQRDQDIKLIVRDEILKHSNEIFPGNINPKNAKEIIEPKLHLIEEMVNKVLKENNASYKCTAKIDYEYFSTREYENEITLPAGRYIALIINLGKAEGKNWWCVLFPSLCLPAADKNTPKIEDVFSDKQAQIVSNSKNYVIKFKIVEIIEELKNKANNKS